MNELALIVVKDRDTHSGTKAFLQVLQNKRAKLSILATFSCSTCKCVDTKYI